MSTAHYPATNVSSANGSIKKRIRDTTRLLSRPNLPADLRREQERKLAALQVTLKDAERVEVERRMVTKYRMVKFFERKKALRRLASARASGNEEAVKEAQLDLAYILHYPKDRKYISLYVKEANCDEVCAERAAVRAEIKARLELLGADAMLAKVKTELVDEDSEDEESDEDDEEGSEDEEDSGDSEDSGEEDSGEEDSGEEDSGDDDEEDDEEDDEFYDSDDSEGDEHSFDSNDEDDSEDEEEDDDEDSEDEEDSEGEEEDSEEEGDLDSEEEEDSDNEEPTPKKRRN